MTVKSIYFAQRNPALGERFRPRWRRHAALAMSMPTLWDLIERYAQCDPLAEVPAALGATARYDAVGISWYRNFEARQALQHGEVMQRMRQDEIEIFGRPVGEVAFRCIETVLKDDGQGPIKVFSVVDRGEGVTAADFPARLRDGLAADLLAAPALAGRLSRLSVGLPLPGAEPGPGRRNDGLLELSFHTLPDAAAFFASEAYATVARAHRPWVVEVERIATREVVLDDRALYD